jgi:hypothetical protein
MVTSGRRSRKTLVATRKVLLKALRTPNGRFFHAAPTWQQARKIFWDHPYNSIYRNTRAFWLHAPRETEPMTVYLQNGSVIEVWSMEKPARLEGAPVNGFHITELPNVRNCKQIWDAHLRPLLADTGGFAILDGVPDMHAQSAIQYREMAEYAAGGVIPIPEPGIGTFAENPDDLEWCFYSWLSSDVLKKSELDAIRRSTDPKMYAQEWEGSFQRLQGLAYYAFIGDVWPQGNIDNTAHYDRSLPVYIGMDFNVDPMTAVLKHHVRCPSGDNAGRVESHVFAGYSMRNSNTAELIKRIFAEYPDAPYYTLTPCQSAHARQTVADLGVTDTTIIEQTARDMQKILYIDKHSRNPLIRDRINLTNARLYHKLIRVNGNDDGCKELIRDWSAMGWKEGTTELDLSDTMRGHISAAFDYSEYMHFDIGMGMDTGSHGVGAVF